MLDPTQALGKITYQLQYRRCGKPNCRCHHEGVLHGPYIYKYWRVDGRLKSGYVGKPASLQTTANDPRLSQLLEGLGQIVPQRQ